MLKAAVRKAAVYEGREFLADEPSQRHGAQQASLSLADALERDLRNGHVRSGDPGAACMMQAIAIAGAGTRRWSEVVENASNSSLVKRDEFGLI